MENRNLYLDGVMGLVVGDALGVPAEFASREELRNEPVTKMEGYGTYPMPAGSWSDDSSMALATLAALNEGYDSKKIMENFVLWEQYDEFTPTGELFDEGNTCSTAIYNYIESPNVYTCGLTGANNNGNGSLMRILPACIYVYIEQKNEGLTDEESIKVIHDISALTHAHIRSKIACGLYYFCVRAIADKKGNLKQCLQYGLNEGFKFYKEDISNLTELSYFNRIKDLDEFKNVPESDIKSGGYVIESIEASIWCLINTENYKDCILKAVNLGNDTDTTAAIAGGLAGLYYGYENIPVEWKDAIIKREWIEELCRGIFSSKVPESLRVVDIHSHLLPKIDDGSRTPEMSITMMKQAIDEGVTDLFLTPHSDFVLDDPNAVSNEFQSIKMIAERVYPNLNLYLGSEVLCSLDGDETDVGLINYEKDGLKTGRIPTYNDTEYILLEFLPEVTPDEAYTIVKEIKDLGYKPILAHAERYPKLVKAEIPKTLVDMGCMIQINAYSLVEETNDRTKRAARYLLGRKLVHFIGSDAHRLDHRPPKMKIGIEYIFRTCDREYAEAVCYKNAEKYLNV